MRRIVLIVLILIFLLLASLFSSSAISDTTTGPDDILGEDYIFSDNSDEEPWWKHWSRDGNRNGIDDLIDEKIAAGSAEKIAVYLKYGRELKDTDAELAKFFEYRLQNPNGEYHFS